MAKNPVVVALEEQVGRLRRTVATQKKRLMLLEGLLLCVHCDHLRNEHGADPGGPCYGGRSPDLKPGEGEYCTCPGFEAAEG